MSIDAARSVVQSVNIEPYLKFEFLSTTHQVDVKNVVEK